ncbi:MAG: ribonuclease P protein component [Bacilli bacterium]|nr:ribonuclease P protein component [Bacilli bacterium]
MRRFEMVKKHSDFDDIIQNGKYKKNKAYIIYNKVNEKEFPRWGLAVGKKIGDAHIRNKVKRQVREIVRANKKLFQNNKDYIIIVKKSVLDMDFDEMTRELVSLIK